MWDSMHKEGWKLSSILLKEIPISQTVLFQKTSVNLQLRAKKSMSSKWSCKYFCIAWSNNSEKGEWYLRLRVPGML